MLLVFLAFGTTVKSGRQGYHLDPAARRGWEFFAPANRFMLLKGFKAVTFAETCCKQSA